jgi:hypothetical protein
MNTSVANVILIFLSIILYSINEKFNSQNICKNIKFVSKYQKNMMIKERKKIFLLRHTIYASEGVWNFYKFSVNFIKK